MMRCTCLLAIGAADTVPAHLHDEDCALYFAMLEREHRKAEKRLADALEAEAMERRKARFKALGHAAAMEVAEGIRNGTWTTED